jgi:hypothetical protein
MERIDIHKYGKVILKNIGDKESVVKFYSFNGKVIDEVVISPGRHYMFIPSHHINIEFAEVEKEIDQYLYYPDSPMCKGLVLTLPFKKDLPQ